MELTASVSTRLPDLRRRAVAASTTSVVLLVVVGIFGPSAASPPLGERSWHPAWDLGLNPPANLVVALQAAAYVLGGLAVWWGLRAVAAGWRPDSRRVLLFSLLAVVGLVLVPPFGSADQLSYAAYGRIAAQGDDPYLVAPDAWRGGADPVASAARPPWADTPSVYGPVASAVQATASLAGGDSVRLTVWFLQLLVGAGFLVTALIIDRTTRPDEALRARAVVLWAMNPVLLGVLVGGAHLDAICSAAAMAALVLATGRSRAVGPFLAGLSVGVAAGIKLPYGAVGLALATALVWQGLCARRGLPARSSTDPRDTWVRLGLLAIGSAIVLVPAHLWAGPHVYDQARRASRFTSLATAWRTVMNGLDAVVGPDPRAALPVLTALLGGVVLLAVLGCRLRSEPGLETGPADLRAASAQIFLAFAVTYLLVSPYVLPWYDALGWAPLAIVAGGFGLDGALLLRSTTLALAYTPGLVGGSSHAEALMLGFRTWVAPLITFGVLVWVLARGLRPAWRELEAAVRGRPSGRRPISPG